MYDRQFVLLSLMTFTIESYLMNKEMNTRLNLKELEDKVRFVFDQIQQIKCDTNFLQNYYGECHVCTCRKYSFKSLNVENLKLKKVKHHSFSCQLLWRIMCCSVFIKYSQYEQLSKSRKSNLMLIFFKIIMKKCHFCTYKKYSFNSQNVHNLKLKKIKPLRSPYQLLWFVLFV